MILAPLRTKVERLERELEDPLLAYAPWAEGLIRQELSVALDKLEKSERLEMDIRRAELPLQTI